MKIHALATAGHYAEHVLAVWKHLDDDLRGQAWCPPVDVINPTVATRVPNSVDPGDIVMVASFSDIAAAGDRRVIHVEHGAGQRYIGGNEKASRHYHGSTHPENVIGYISPRQDVADSWGRPAYAAGSPVCDPYQLFSPEKVAAISFHWNGAPPHMVGVPEAGTAFEHYVNHLPDIVVALEDEGYEVLGHRHPRFGHLHSVWTKLGIREAGVDEVRRRAQLLIADNTSLMYEMTYLWRDVITLNAPWFRRDVDHGLRFWTHAPGTEVDDVDELLVAIREPRSPSPMEINEYVYGKTHADGNDGARAAAWITALVHGL